MYSRTPIKFLLIIISLYHRLTILAHSQPTCSRIDSVSGPPSLLLNVDVSIIITCYNQNDDGLCHCNLHTERCQTNLNSSLEMTWRYRNTVININKMGDLAVIACGKIVTLTRLIICEIQFSNK